MLNYNDAFYGLRNSLQPLYDASEAAAIAHEVMHHITGADKLKRLVEKDTIFTPAQQAQYEDISAALLAGKPLQYAIGHSWFMGRAFTVNEQVLIPRPETEELVQWAIDDYKERDNCEIVDIGTGSGCIPVSLKLALPAAAVTAVDVSNGALEVAAKNAAQLHADISFRKIDFLTESGRNELGNYDIIISNPPYIPETEKEHLHTNVRDHEPGLALFVPGDDALLFYRAIAEFGKMHLKQGGAIYCELHMDYASATKELFEQKGYTVILKKDMHGNLRMLKAI